MNSVGRYSAHALAWPIQHAVTALRTDAVARLQPDWDSIFMVSSMET
jgi:hypothetical protein